MMYNVWLKPDFPVCALIKQAYCFTSSMHLLLCSNTAFLRTFLRCQFEHLTACHETYSSLAF